MAHCINALLGYNNRISFLAEKWFRNPLQLPQGLSMLFLDEDLFNDIDRLNNSENKIHRIANWHILKRIILAG